MTDNKKRSAVKEQEHKYHSIQHAQRGGRHSKWFIYCSISGFFEPSFFASSRKPVEEVHVWCDGGLDLMANLSLSFPARKDFLSTVGIVC